MSGRVVRVGSLLLLAVIFTAGLTFATLELPYYVDEVLQNTIATPDADSHVDTVSRLKTELFMAHFHVRLIGYVAFFLLVGLIVAGFATKRTGLATLGAVGVMLPAFAQFAGVMFFLAGLGVLNAIWLPVLDVSYELQNWGLVILAPDDALRWLLRQVGIHSRWPTIVLFTGMGILIFLLGVYAWLTARARGKDVADFWIYRVSRHPQYLGWIVWTYGAFLLIQLMRYPKRSWGIGASLPWLLSTMVIIGVALVEELNMRRRFGEAYAAYRARAPFLFPAPRIVERFFALPCRMLFEKDRPDRVREVVATVTIWTVVLIAVSAVFYADGVERTRRRFASEASLAAQADARVAELAVETDRRRRYHLTNAVVSFGDAAVEPLARMLTDEDPGRRTQAANALGRIGSERAVPALRAALADSVDDVRYRATLALSAIGSDAAVEPLLRLLESPDDGRRLEALRGLARFRPDVVLEHLPEFLDAESYWMRSQAIDVLGGPAFEAAVPVVAASLTDEQAWVRRAAVVALLRIGSAAARPALERMAHDDDFEVRIYAAEALQRLPR